MKNLLLLFCSIIVIACYKTSSKEKLLIEYMVPKLKEGVYYRSHKLNQNFTFIFKNELKKIDDRNWILEIIYMDKDSVPFQISKERYCGTDSIVNEYLAEIRIENGVAKEYELVDISNYSSNFKPEELTKVVRIVKYSDKTSEIHSQVSLNYGSIDTLGVRIKEGLHVSSLDSTVITSADSVFIRKYKSDVFYTFKKGFEDLKLSWFPEEKYSKESFNKK